MQGLLLLQANAYPGLKHVLAEIMHGRTGLADMQGCQLSRMHRLVTTPMADIFRWHAGMRITPGGMQPGRTSTGQQHLASRVSNGVVTALGKTAGHLYASKQSRASRVHMGRS